MGAEQCEPPGDYNQNLVIAYRFGFAGFFCRICMLRQKIGIVYEKLNELIYSLLPKYTKVRPIIMASNPIILKVDSGSASTFSKINFIFSGKAK